MRRVCSMDLNGDTGALGVKLDNDLSSELLFPLHRMFVLFRFFLIELSDSLLLCVCWKERSFFPGTFEIFQYLARWKFHVSHIKWGNITVWTCGTTPHRIRFYNPRKPPCRHFSYECQFDDR
jgi:hypothetical protein